MSRLAPPSSRACRWTTGHSPARDIVPQAVWRDVLGLQARLLDRGPVHRECQSLRYVAPGHRMPGSIGQQCRRSAQLRVGVQPSADGRCRGLPQRHRAILAALAVQMLAGRAVHGSLQVVEPPVHLGARTMYRSSRHRARGGRVQTHQRPSCGGQLRIVETYA
jgi:hypothetical protein